ncbi:MAG: hypothetical protein IPJ81_19555 [Chitinophagaceae bacterium]|nr:hypothetical protein [Chitinophagaceae bacterium]
MKSIVTFLLQLIKTITQPNLQQPAVQPLPAFWQMIPIKNMDKQPNNNSYN